METGIKSGWLKPREASPIDRPQRLPDEEDHVQSGGRSEAFAVGFNGAPGTEPDPGSPEYQAADNKARTLEADTERTLALQRDQSSRSSTPREGSMAVPTAPGLPATGAILSGIGTAAGRAASLVARATPAAAAASILLLPSNSGAEFHPLGENLRVRTAPGQLSATVQLKVDDGFFGSGIGAKWIDLPVKAEWAIDDQTNRGYIAVDQLGLEQAIGRDATAAALGGNGIAMAGPPSKDDGDEGDVPGLGHNSKSFGENLQPQPSDEDPKPPLDPAPLALPAADVPERVRSRINLNTGNRKIGWTHATEGHFDPTRTGKSQFTISKAELRSLLQSKEVVRSPIVHVLKSREGPRYVREVTLSGRDIGIDVTTQRPTSTLTVLTDKYGNLVTTHPGRMQ